MGNCDVCGNFTSWESGTSYTADEFRAIVRKGFEPPSSVVILGPVAVQGWKNGLVANSTTGWLLCPTCAEIAKRYLPKTAGTGPAGHILYETMAQDKLLGVFPEKQASVEIQASPTLELVPTPTRLSTDIIRKSNKICPTCKKEIDAVTVSCPYCGAQFEVVIKGYCSKEHAMMTCNEKGICLACGQDIIDMRVESTLVEVEKLSPPEPVQVHETETTESASIAPPVHPYNKPAADTKKCPMCAEEIKAEARLCRFCGAKFVVVIKGYCTYDHQLFEANAEGKCMNCRGELIDTYIDSKLVEAISEIPANLVPNQTAHASSKLPKPIPIPPAEVKRPGCITAYAIMLWIGSGFLVFASLGGGGSLISTSIDGGTTIMIVLLGMAILTISLGIGLWRLKNWARITVIVLLSLTFLINIGIISINASRYSGGFGGAQGIGTVFGAIIYFGVTVEMFSWFVKNGHYFKQKPAAIV